MTFLPRFICKCAKVAKRKGYEVFGVQYYAECWANKTYTPSTLSSHRVHRRRCVNGHFKPCPKNGLDRLCTGKSWANFVYILKEVRMSVYVLFRRLNQRSCDCPARAVVGDSVNVQFTSLCHKRISSLLVLKLPGTKKWVLRELICSTVTEEHKLDRFPNVLQLVCNTTDACIYIRIT